MVFSSLIFVYIFFPLTILGYFLMPNMRAKNILLLVASLLFYTWGEPVWVLLLIFTAIINYYLALLIEKYRDKRQSKAFMISAVTLNLILLGVFKYLGFFIQNFNFITRLSIPIPSIILPLGISFYTFQIISYLVDCYWGKVKASHNLMNFMLYVALFPKLIQGPIVRYVDVERQIKCRKTTFHAFSEGATRFLIGLGKKVLIANTIGNITTTLLGANQADMSVLSGWVGIVMFTLQIYFDFSGYSDMAIGLGKIFGFHFLENFNYPYISTSITDFWRRWHISLSSFFRDYVYIPLGGNRKRLFLNLFVVWSLTGLWHGANWNFILWGLYFFVILFFEKSFLLKFFSKIPKAFSHIYAVILIVLGWVFFYFTDLNKCFYMFKLLFGAANVPLYDLQTLLLIKANGILILFAILACIPFSSYIKKSINYASEHYKHGRRSVFILTLVFDIGLLFVNTSFLVGSSFNPFIYFRF